MKAMPGTLDLAAAGMIDLATAADIATNVLSGFGLEAEQMGRVGDVMAKAAASANTSVFELGDAMKFSAPLASKLGIEIEELSAGIGVLSNAGIKGGEAGTTLRRVMLSLIKPSQAAQKVMQKYNLTLADLDPTVHGFTNVLEKLKDAQISAADAAAIFEARGVTGFLALADAVPELRDLTDEFKKAAGAAREMAEIRLDNLEGDWLKLKSAVAEVVLASGEDGLTGSLRGAVQMTTDGVRKMGGSWNWIRDAITDVYISLMEIADQTWTALDGGTADLMANFQVAWYGLKGIILGIFASIEETFGKMIAGILTSLQTLVDKAAMVASILPGGAGERLQAVSGRLGSAAGVAGGPSAARQASEAAFGTAEGIMGDAEAAQKARLDAFAQRSQERAGAKKALGGIYDPAALEMTEDGLAGVVAEAEKLDNELADMEQRNAFDVLGDSLQSFTNGFDNALNRFGDFQQRLNDMGEGMAFSIDANLTDALTDFVMGTKSAEEAFAQFAQAMISDLIRIMIQQIVVRSLMTALGGIGGAGMAHAGGVAGGSLPTHPTAQAGDFSGARHFQGGGMAGDEVPIVAHRGEGVFTEDQMEALGQAINGGDRQRPVEIINVADPSMVDERIAANPDATLNVINRNRQSIRRILGLGT
jgi:TP901 family phage tail tape measure protein